MTHGRPLPEVDPQTARAAIWPAARSSLEGGRILNSSQGGDSKDTWPLQ